MPVYHCKSLIVWKPGKDAQSSDADTKIVAEVPPATADAIADLTTGDLASRSLAYEHVLGVLDAQYGDSISTLIVDPDWAIGTNGLHEDQRSLNRSGTPWYIDVKRKSDPSKTTRMFAELRVQSTVV